MFTSEQENLIKKQDNSVRQVFNSVPELNNECGFVINKSAYAFDLSRLRKDVSYYNDKYCKDIYFQIYEDLLKKNQVNNFRTEFTNYYCDIIFKTFSKDEKSRINQNIITAIDNEITNPEKNVQNNKLRMWHKEIVNEILSSTPIVNDMCSGNNLSKNVLCQNLIDSMIFTIFGKCEYGNKTTKIITETENQGLQYLFDPFEDIVLKPTTKRMIGEQIFSKINVVKDKINVTNDKINVTNDKINAANDKINVANDKYKSRPF